MNMHLMGKPGETLTDARDQEIAALRHITAEQLRHLGARKVVYLKAATWYGEQAFVVFGADGTLLVVVDDAATAAAMVAGHGLDFVTLHWTEGTAVPVIATSIEPHRVTRVFFDCRAVVPKTADLRCIEQAVERSIALPEADDERRWSCLG